MISVHGGLKEFECSECNFKAGYKDTLVKHRSIHMDLKQYSCQFCGYKHCSRKNMLKHIRQHHLTNPTQIDQERKKQTDLCKLMQGVSMFPFIKKLEVDYHLIKFRKLPSLVHISKMKN